MAVDRHDGAKFAFLHDVMATSDAHNNEALRFKELDEVLAGRSG